MSNARTKRLNESDKPVINFGIADDLHKLIIPQNTTANLAQITPNEIGSIAYDTTLNKVVVNSGSGFNVINITGVTTLNSLSGAVDITAGSGITVTPSGNNLQVATAGASGTFTTADSKTVTVVNGLITSIV